MISTQPFSIDEAGHASHANRPAAPARAAQVLDAYEQQRAQCHAIYTRLFRDEARDSAEAAHERGLHGTPLSAIDGLLVSLKDSIDVEGYATLAGSPALARRRAATHDAELVSALRGAGAIVIGKTHMTELAFSGLGLNPQALPLANPRDPARVTGGSSSGAAASVAAGLADIAIGGDTGGSIRIPAAFCGVVGFKPSFGRVSNRGIFPLSSTLDCAGPIANTVVLCVDAWRVLSGTHSVQPTMSVEDDVHFIVPHAAFFERIDDDVTEAFHSSIDRLRQAGATIVTRDLSFFAQATRKLDAIGMFTAPELAARLRFEGVADDAALDPLVRGRLDAARLMPASNYVFLAMQRDELKSKIDAQLGTREIVLMPTTPCSAPKREALTTLAAQSDVNARVTELTRAANLFDLPALSLPMEGVLTGLMLTGARGADDWVLRVAQAIEAALF
ncbi:amidase [Paraburkholderia tropica]|uniref:amidase n=1 Tax=Paraburkholderia tropica TaxID=92647 RepID=UPI002AB75413|nr:amidase family protein [Paraburkholderia tropica]